MKEETSNEARKFVNIEWELKLGRKEKVVVKVELKKDKIKMSPDKMVATRNKCFTPNHMRGC